MTSLVPLAELTAYLDGYLRIREVPDDGNAVNGLQVENRGMVGRIVATVDATLAAIQGLGPAGGVPALQLVHHGLFWDGNQPVTGRRYRRLAALLERDAALYSAHIPLDLHAEVGNNAVLARRLGLEATASFGNHKGTPIGVMGTPTGGVTNRDRLVGKLAAALGIAPSAVKVVPGGPGEVRRGRRLHRARPEARQLRRHAPVHDDQLDGVDGRRVLREVGIVDLRIEERRARERAVRAWTVEVVEDLLLEARHPVPRRVDPIRPHELSALHLSVSTRSWS